MSESMENITGMPEDILLNSPTSCFIRRSFTLLSSVKLCDNHEIKGRGEGQGIVSHTLKFREIIIGGKGGRRQVKEIVPTSYPGGICRWFILLCCEDFTAMVDKGDMRAVDFYFSTKRLEYS